MTDTIAAIATGNTVSAIGIIRISGEKSIEVVNTLFQPASGIKLCDAESKYMHYGQFSDIDGRILDLCLCMISRAPDSYTGENCVELHCHGSPIVLSEILNILHDKGIRHALPGEFTKRAFLNGRMDLSSAEAVIDLIESETLAAAYNAAGQLFGAVSGKMGKIYSKLLDIMAHFHVTIDYPDEDIDDFSLTNYLATLKEIQNELQIMLDSHNRGKILKSGIPTAIVGRPNTGKSSLLNALLGYERAIVTEIPGTTRDSIEEKVLFGGTLLRLVDTAGLRNSSDIVERMGIERTEAIIKNADLILIVFDGSEPLSNEDYEVLQLVPEEMPKIAVINKSDLPQKAEVEMITNIGIEVCALSALTGAGIDNLDVMIREKFPVFSSLPTGELITNMRQADAIKRTMESINNAAASLNEAVTPDAVLTDIEAATATIGEVIGKTMQVDIIDRIFERFCVGK